MEGKAKSGVERKNERRVGKSCTSSPRRRDRPPLASPGKMRKEIKKPSNQLKRSCGLTATAAWSVCPLNINSGRCQIRALPQFFPHFLFPSFSHFSSLPSCTALEGIRLLFSHPLLLSLLLTSHLARWRIPLHEDVHLRRTLLARDSKLRASVRPHPSFPRFSCSSP